MSAKTVTLNLRQLRQLARDATILAAAVKLYVPTSVNGLHRAAANRVLKMLATAQDRKYRGTSDGR